MATVYPEIEYWALTDLELALQYEDIVEGRSRDDFHWLQHELDNRAMNLDDLEMILAEVQEQC